MYKIIIIPIREINHEISNETIESIRFNTKLIAVSGVCFSSLLHVYGFVFCSISILFVYMCVRMLQVQGPLRECPQTGRFRASLLLHTTGVRL